ncbi:hypothetical protein L5515_001510 [Caenorhabditis briggsae]|uniref:Uncharacterized protein n=1 Tax=Caenorhabditis briggsae TaxID=6238 RepID=A0AAE9DW69_CAEBR|nr:hypothetical protein L3Y34_015433 [Caenorhabditis briggsae]UMM13030.1 hypothetical protein L5515_001510 [Caenorhabditis briggsae]
MDTAGQKKRGFFFLSSGPVLACRPLRSATVIRIVSSPSMFVRRRGRKMKKKKKKKVEERERGLKLLVSFWHPDGL